MQRADDLADPPVADVRDARRQVRRRRLDVRRKLILLAHFLEAAGWRPELSRTPAGQVSLNGRTYS